MTLELHGQHMIGDELSAASSKTFTAMNPATGEALAPAFHEGAAAEADRAMTLAESVFDELRAHTPDQLATLLESITDEIMSLGDTLLERCNSETGLPRGRLEAERGRTVNQAKLFAQVVREGSWVEARIDTAQPDRKPAPRPDIRRMLMPIGPVVVFGASNFPLAISVAGTDTISALGCGCPVVVKAHPGHPGTCELMGRAIQAALKKCNMPAGAFSLLHGAGHEIGMALVTHRAAKAVGFTGSLKAGRAIFDAAAARPSPIPVYAEMGSTNPVFILPGALAANSETLAQGYVQSVTLGVGQFCTNPGLVLGLKGSPLDGFVDQVKKLAAEAAPATMLHAGIHAAYESGVAAMEKTAGVALVGRSQTATGQTQGACAIFKTNAATFESSAQLREEVFGPSSLIIEADASAQLERIAESLEGHLTATIHGTPDDLKQHRRLVTILERKVGRLLFGGFPTGVEVCHAMHHGGPYPATIDPHFTSIGTAAIHRFARPICYQSFPDDALPVQLRNRNAMGIWRMVDGDLTKEDVT